jgi:hypothetical protein
MVLTFREEGFYEHRRHYRYAPGVLQVSSKPEGLTVFAVVV